ncbi:hypothetical protein [Rhizobium sullae]|uniref:Uncharacterized protein n=1 Tax=Rhizobium sullae TaxID=50338 RepID=A0A4R3QKL0_RHISU|nr:hypothetical protein [Rhizobium sullae]TCU18806.1 hypothetical protein EV132_10233 [Rhizobium sullae]
MTTDNSYTPIFCEFEHVIAAYYPPTITPEQMQMLKVMFFAGASAAYELLIKTPERAETMKEEILDQADQFQAA